MFTRNSLFFAHLYDHKDNNQVDSINEKIRIIFKRAPSVLKFWDEYHYLVPINVSLSQSDTSAKHIHYISISASEKSLQKTNLTIRRFKT